MFSLNEQTNDPYGEADRTNEMSKEMVNEIIVPFRAKNKW